MFVVFVLCLFDLKLLAWREREGREECKKRKERASFEFR